MGISDAENDILFQFNGTFPSGYVPDCTTGVNCLLAGYVKAQVDYYPTFHGTLLYLIIFIVLLVVQIIQGLVWRTWSYTTFLVVGLILECVGYVGTLSLDETPFFFNSFTLYLIFLTISPIFFTSAIYLSFSRLIQIYDPATLVSRFTPKVFSIFFISTNSFSLILKAVGGALASTAESNEDKRHGILVMTAGLAVQGLALIVFGALCAEFALGIRRMSSPKTCKHHKGVKGVVLDTIFGNKLLRTGFGIRSLYSFQLAQVVATSSILLRSIYRSVELSGGCHGKLQVANEEATFMFFEVVLVLISLGCLTVWHPGWMLKDCWSRSGGESQDVEMGEFVGSRETTENMGETKRDSCRDTVGKVSEVKKESNTDTADKASGAYTTRPENMSRETYSDVNTQTPIKDPPINRQTYI